MKSLPKILMVAALLTCGAYTLSNADTPAKINKHKDVQDRHLSGFHGVNVMGSFDVYIVQGPAEAVKVEAPAAMMSHIVTVVEDGELKIYDKHDSNWNWKSLFGGHHNKIAVYVTANDLDHIGISGSGDVYFKDGIHSESLTIKVSGSGDVYGKVDVKNLECNISGSGDMSLSGHAENSMVGVSGSGDFTARGLVTTNTSVHVSGSGDASINASNSIDASVSGSGDVTYTGGAQHILKSKSGSGDISGN